MLAGSLWAEQAEAQPGLRGGTPRAGGLLARDPTLCTGGHRLQKPCTMNVFLEAAAEVGQGQGGCAQPWLHQVLGVWGEEQTQIPAATFSSHPLAKGGGPGGLAGKPCKFAQAPPRLPAHTYTGRGPWAPELTSGKEAAGQACGTGPAALALMSALATRGSGFNYRLRRGSGREPRQRQSGGCGGQRDWGGALPLRRRPRWVSLCLGPIRDGSGPSPALPSGGPVKGAIVGLWAAAQHSGC